MNRQALAQELEAIVTRIRCNGPRHRDPERFHEERSEIAEDAMTIVRKLRSRDPLD